jgi:tungstate transport system substrate-binding protein
MCRRVSTAFVACAMLWTCRAPGRQLVLATTTSVANSGLLDVLLPAYERERQVLVRAHMVGSGRALAMLESGQADVAITHAPNAETVALEKHPSWAYAKIMFNDFVLAGPALDPAGVRGAASVAAAMARVARSKERFISRGDQSGTHEREEALWLAAGVRPPPGQLVVAGAGMGATLRIATETASYTLTDRATYLQQEPPDSMAILYERDNALLNTYSVIFDPAGARAGDARSFAAWLSSGGGRRVIDEYRAGAGVRAFELWPSGHARSRPTDLPR